MLDLVLVNVGALLAIAWIVWWFWVAGEGTGRLGGNEAAEADLEALRR